MRIRVEHRPEDGEWHRIGPGIGEGDQLGSGTAHVDGASVVVIFGWFDQAPEVRTNTGPSTRLGHGVRGHIAGEQERLADLRQGPFELDGPNGRWRWSLVD